MIMDYQDSVGVSRVRPYSDSDREIWVRWYKCQPGALPFPGITWGGSPQYEPDPNRFEGPGIFRRGAAQRLPTVSPFDGSHYSGTLDQFRYGVPVALAGGPVATVCGIPLLASAGGVVLGGSAWGSATAIGSLAQVQRLTGLVDDRRDARGQLAQVQGLPGSVVVGARVVGQLGQVQRLGGGVCSGSGVSGGLSQRQTLTGTIATTVVSSGTAAEASGASGSTSVIVSSAGTVAEASSASGSTATSTAVAGQLAQVQTLPGQLGTGTAVSPGTPLAQTQTLTGSMSSGSGNPIVTDCSVCPGGTYTYWYFSLSGITGSSDCVLWNGSWTLTKQTGTCVWGYILGGLGYVAELQLASLSAPTLTIYNQTTGFPQAVYGLTSGSWNCLGPTNTLSILSAPQCAGWPAAITLTS